MKKMIYIYTILAFFLASNLAIGQNNKTDELFTIDKATVSTDKAEFGAFLTDNNTLYFTRENKVSQNNKETTTSLDIYKTSFNSDGTTSEINPVSSLNTKWHDGPITVSKDGKTMYFASESFNTRKGFEKEITKNKIIKKGKIYLFKSTLLEGKWSNITPVPFNSPNYSCRNPSISPDGKTLYFSSNRPDGIGGEDIWKVSINGNSYGSPENLGATINSESNESFPFITEDNTLYFSSDSSKGFGGLDIYKIELANNTGVINLGTPLNSNKDDFSFSFNTSQKIGFFSSNRNGNGNDDIYIAKPICRTYANITITDNETGEKITHSNILLTHNNIDIENIQSSEEKTKFKIDCHKSYALIIKKEGYNNLIHIIDKPINGGELNIAIKLKANDKPIITETEVILNPIFFEFDKSNITPQGANELDKLITVMKEHPDMNIFVKSHTDNKGKTIYNLKLSDLRAKVTVQYIILKGISENRISGKGFGESELKINCEECTEEENSQNRRSEFKIIKK